MNPRVIAFLLGSLVLLHGAWADKTPTGEAKMKNADLPTLAEDSNTFALQLYARLADKNAGNLFLSPASIDTALAMTYAGANGQTATQMAATLHFNLPADRLHPAFAALLESLNHPAQIQEMQDVAGEVKPESVPAYALVIANALWGQKDYPFKPEFTALVAKNYGGALNPLDFSAPESARKTINTWVAEKTHDKIKDLIPPKMLTDRTRLVLTNAIYFKSDWAEKFQKEATHDAPFTLSSSKTATVPMMHQREHFAYMENDDLQAVELAYKADALSMVILLPKKVDGLSALEQNLTAENLTQWLKNLQPASVILTLPKWKFSSDFSLADTLKSLGMTDAFDPDKADFSGIATEKPLYISAVIHKAFVAVDEEGTEAAAATAIIVEAGAVPMPRQQPKTFTADHPFLFLIRHNPTGEILFLGRVANPKE